MMYYVEIVLNDGRVARRTNLKKSVAQKMHDDLVNEFIFFDIKKVTWGLMK